MMTMQPSDPSRVASPPAPGGAGYGPVRASDTLWSIAARVRPDDSVSVQRMMLALLVANPEAFATRNVNALKAGVTLRIPGRDELGPDDRKAAVAELKRQHAAWAQYRESVRVAPVPSAPVPSAPVPSAPGPFRPGPLPPRSPPPRPLPPRPLPPRHPPPSPRDAEPEPSGRIEVVSPKTTMNAAGGKEDADIRALRNELALAVEEADASRRENAELKFRLAEVEGQIKELIRLVALKSEEIAALQAELRAMAAMRPKPAPQEREPKPAPRGGEPRPAPREGEPKSMPFGLGALPVSPVFLVGGAGLLLILLGVVALLRRRSLAGGHNAPGPADPPSSGEDGLLLELEAVAAELTDETDDPQGRRSRAAPAVGRAGDMEPGAVQSDVARTEPESLAEKRAAELWKDAPETESVLSSEPAADDVQDYDVAIRRQEPVLSGEPAADDDKADVSFDIDTLVRDDSDSGAADDEAAGDFDIGDFADSDAERKGGSTAPAGEAAGDPDLHSSRREARTVDSAAPVPTTDAERPADLVHGIPDDRREDAALVTPAGEASVDTGPRTPGTARPDPGRKLVATDDERVDPGPGPDWDYSDSTVTPRTVVDDRADHAGTRAISMEDFSEDEVQTMIDLAQVYMEMGDTDSARGFIEAVLAEGDADQRDAAREMLSKLS